MLAGVSKDSSLQIEFLFEMSISFFSLDINEWHKTAGNARDEGVYFQAHLLIFSSRV